MLLLQVGDTVDLQQTSSLPLYGALRRAAQGGVRLLRLVNDYAPANVSDKVLRIIISYTDFVNRKVWKKSPA